MDKIVGDIVEASNVYIRCCENYWKNKIEQLKSEIEKLREALEKIDSWTKAYPLEMFPEPDFKKVAEVLKAAGLSLDEVSASNMRHVITKLKDITEQALKEKDEQDTLD